jgi:hypothetical protein
MGDDVPGTTADAAELHEGFGFHRRHHSPDAGTVGGAAGTTGGGAGPVTGGTTGSATAGMGGATAGGGATADCDICTQAQQCCYVVEADPGCSFSAVTCASMVGDARPAYVNACLTFVVTVRAAWSGNPPAECR